MGTIFHEEILKYGSDFQNWRTPGNLENLVCFCKKIARNGYLFFRKIPKCVPILGKITLQHGYGSWAAGSTSLANPNLSTPLGLKPPKFNCQGTYKGGIRSLFDPCVNTIGQLPCWMVRYLARSFNWSGQSITALYFGMYVRSSRPERGQNTLNKNDWQA